MKRRGPAAIRLRLIHVRARVSRLEIASLRPCRAASMAACRPLAVRRNIVPRSTGRDMCPWRSKKRFMAVSFEMSGATFADSGTTNGSTDSTVSRQSSSDPRTRSGTRRWWPHARCVRRTYKPAKPKARPLPATPSSHRLHSADDASARAPPISGRPPRRATRRRPAAQELEDRLAHLDDGGGARPHAGDDVGAVADLRIELAVLVVVRLALTFISGASLQSSRSRPTACSDACC